MRGRKPTPTALRVLRGNPRKRPVNAREPKPAPLAAIDPPTWLDGDAQAEWRRLAPLLSRLGVLTETDADALAAYCEAWTTWKQATQKMRRDGLVVEGKGGAFVSPYVKIAHQSLALMRAFLTEFGMTPSSRARIHTATEAPTSRWGGHL